MSRAARFLWVCAVTAGLCFVALAVVSKTSIEPEAMLIFDSRLGGYSTKDAQAFLSALTQVQTLTYLGMFRQLDTVFPVLLCTAMLGAIWLNTSGEVTRRRVLACVGPLAYLALDLLENATVAKMLKCEGQLVVEFMNCPARFDAVVMQASTYTQGKWMTLALSCLVVLWAWRFAAKERSAT